MYILDVSYKVEQQEHSQSYLLSDASDGFTLKQTIGDDLAEKHNSEVEVLSTELEEL